MSITYDEIKLENIRDVVYLAEKMHGESAYADMPFDFEFVAQRIYSEIIQSEDGFGLIAYKDTNPVGMIGGGLATQFFGPTLFAFDYGWYVTPKQRGSSIAVRLLKKFEKWAEKRGAKEIHLGVTTGVSPDRTAKMFDRMGYKYVGKNYTLKL